MPIVPWSRGSNTPQDPDPYRALAGAVIYQAVADIRDWEGKWDDEVARLVRCGCTNAEIVRRTGLSRMTVQGQARRARGVAAARRFLAGSAGFEFWCALAGVDAQQMKAGIARGLEEEP